MKVDVNQFGDKAGASGIAIESATPNQMDAVLANATANDVGKIFQYTGETNEQYEHGAYYQIAVEE
jgi:hypothetical protein